MPTTPPYLLGVDVGTTNCKVMLIDSAGAVLARSQSAYDTTYSREDWAEQNAEDWYCALVKGTQRCVHTADVPPDEIVALSICGPAHNIVLLDGEGRVLQPVILWSDRRSAPQAEWLEAESGPTIFEETFQPVNPGWSLSQLLWVRQNRPEVWRSIHRIIIGKDYLSNRLAGFWHTDWYDAMGTQMFDARVGAWSRAIRELLGLSLDCLPPVCDATEAAGRVTKAAANDTGLAPGTLVAVGSGDSVVEALAAGVIEPGQCFANLPARHRKPGADLSHH